MDHNLYLKNTNRASTAEVLRYINLLKYSPFKSYKTLEWSAKLPYRARLPIIDFKNKLILFYSAKAGCSTAKKWFLNGAGLLEEAMTHDKWVHRYVVEEYVSKYNYYKQFPKVVGDREYTSLKVVRNPYYRFASSYYHLLKWKEHYFPKGLADDFNMERFLTLLETLQKDILNSHFAPQYSQWEEVFEHLPTEILKLEHLEVNINQVNERYDLENPLTPMVIDKSNAVQRQSSGLTNPHLLPYKTIFENYPKDYGIFFKDEGFKRRVYHFYLSDFEHYNYGYDSI